MKEFRREGYSLDMIREIDIVAYLEKLGFTPEKIRKNGTDHWYLSPFRNESEPSFHVDRANNRWYDFGLSKGGNMVDLCLRYYDCSITELLAKFNTDTAAQRLPVLDAGLHEGRSGKESNLIITDVDPLHSYAVKSYLHDRSIPVAVAEAYCQEVGYKIGGRAYYGIGFKNDSGGYEIRNKYYKQSSSPKDITTLDHQASTVHVFEGFFDLLSYKVLHRNEPEGLANFVVLNGAGMFERALPFLERHEHIGLWLDRDATGRAYTSYALSRGPRYRDESGSYGQYKDLNEWLTHSVGERPKLAQRTGLNVK